MRVNEWEESFDGHAPVYMQDVFTRDSLREAESLTELLALVLGARIVDIGCGTGRHAVELARRRFPVTGLDRSAGMLAQARQAAADAGVSVEWIKADVARFRGETAFDAALCLCEGAFCLLAADDEVDEHDRAVLRAAFVALKPGGRFVLTALNGLAKIRHFPPEDVARGRFEPLALVKTFDVDRETTAGRQVRSVRERAYSRLSWRSGSSRRAWSSNISGVGRPAPGAGGPSSWRGSR